MIVSINCCFEILDGEVLVNRRTRHPSNEQEEPIGTLNGQCFSLLLLSAFLIELLISRPYRPTVLLQLQWPFYHSKLINACGRIREQVLPCYLSIEQNHIQISWSDKICWCIDQIVARSITRSGSLMSSEDTTGHRCDDFCIFRFRSSIG